MDDDQVAASLAAVAAQLRSALYDIELSAARLASPEEREASPELDERAAFLDRSCYRLLRMVDALSEGARLTDERSLRRQPCDLAVLVRRCCAEAVDLAEDQELDLRFDVAMERCPCFIDPVEIRRAFFHLLSNAMKFTPSGGSIRVDLQADDDQVLLSVTDTGSGIPEEQSAVLFDRYLHPERMDPPPHGLGLGLPLCRRIAEAHGGALLWQSRQGRGSRFTLALPRWPDGAPLCYLQDPEPDLFDAVGGHNAALMGLADALGPGAFRIRSQI